VAAWPVAGEHAAGCVLNVNWLTQAIVPWGLHTGRGEGPGASSPMALRNVPTAPALLGASRPAWTVRGRAAVSDGARQES